MILIVLSDKFSYSFEIDKEYGIIKGRVIDRETKAILVGTNVSIVSTNRGTATDSKGNFVINNVPIGNYTVQFNYIGYKPLKITDVIVKSNRITFMQAELNLTVIKGQRVSVSGGYFPQSKDPSISVIGFSSEEIRRAPGVGGDVSRIITGLPSVAKVNDEINCLVVRGGSPLENSFYLDNIEIPNINHFPVLTSTGGTIGLLNVDFIKDVNFFTGVFPASYGNTLSSVMELYFREGNRDEFDGQLDFSMIGIGAIGEGPLATGNGSWLFSVRRSYFELLGEDITEGMDIAYSDFESKIVYDINKQNKLTFLGIVGNDHIDMPYDGAIDNGNSDWGSTKVIEGSVGINWRLLWSKNGFSNTSVAFTFAKYHEKIQVTKTKALQYINKAFERFLNVRNVNHFRLNPTNSIEFGFETKYIHNLYDNFYEEYRDHSGNLIPEITFDDRLSTQNISLFAQHTWSPVNKLSTNIGIRLEYIDYHKDWNVSPRISFSYQITPITAITAATGVFYQTLPSILLSKSNNFKKFDRLSATHYVLGLKHLLTENTCLSLEAYYKDYKNFPLDLFQPDIFIIDEIAYHPLELISKSENLEGNGKAFVKGLEVLLQKKLAKDIYGMISGSYFKTCYKGYNGLWKDRVYDNRFIFSIESGYKPNPYWEFSVRWIYAGGPPYTPFDKNASQAMNQGIYDQNKINEERYPDFHSLNIRVDKRFHFKHSNLIIYFSIWNAYNNKNIVSYFWNEIENKKDTIYQWKLTPILGVEYEF